MVGGGPAGLATALSLAHEAPQRAQGLLVLERDAYPRDKICAGALGDRGWHILEDLGAAPNGVASVRVHGMQLDTPVSSMTVRPGNLGRVVRRIAFDAALAQTVLDRGIALRTGVVVRSVTETSDAVVLQTNQGELRAKAVVGADGVRSVVRRSAGVPAGALRGVVLELDTGPSPLDPPRDTLRFEATEPDLPGYYWDFPTLVDGRPLWCRGLYVLRVARETEDGMQPADHISLVDRMAAYLQARGLRLEDSKNKRFAERGWQADLPVASGRMLLVGEALGIDPVTGEGIAQALESGRDLGRFLATAPLEPDGLAGWDRTHRRSRLAWDLSVRRAAVRPAYGPPRSALETLLADNTALLAAGCHHWAGRRPPLRTLLPALGSVAARAARGALHA